MSALIDGADADRRDDATDRRAPLALLAALGLALVAVLARRRRSPRLKPPF